MSRFKTTPKTVGASTVTASSVTTSSVSDSRARMSAPAPLRQAALSSKPLPISEAGSPNMVASFGFVLYCTYLLSGFANDWAIKLMGNKAYISTIALVLLPVPWLLSGNALRGLQRPVGRWWAAFLMCLLLSTPFSVWKGGSVAMLSNYVPRSYVTFFYICAFTTSLRRCRFLMYANIAGAAVLLLTCLKFGGTGNSLENGRFVIPGSLFFSNANELGLALLLGVTSFLFLVYQPGMGMRILGAAGILLSTIYALKTGSRGCLLAAVAMFGMIFFFSKNKVKTAILALPILGLALLMLPSTTIHRLLLFGTDPGADLAQTTEDESAIGSQLQRRELFKKSLAFTFRHPILGVGPDQFAVAAAGDAAKNGTRSPWLGTHNSYTQVSSECGIPAFICYCAVLGFCFRSNWRLYQQSRDNPALKDVEGLSFCLLASAIVYAVSTFFFHIAYSGGVPMLAGFSLALRLAAEPLLAPRAAGRPIESVVV